MIAATTDKLPLSATYAPGDQAELAETVRGAIASSTPLYPFGGGTALHCGTLGKTPGWGLATEKLNRIVDYPARDMTITVEAGITIETLQQTLAAENQFLPIDVAQAASATLGGAAAVNFSGPRRFGNGTLRDYVIGISAVDGHGTEFKAGGRVVKNVAGYDFCKLLVGSLGTLAIVTQLTLKVKPRPAVSVLLTHDLASLDEAETLAAALVQSRTTPTAVELLAGNVGSEFSEQASPNGKSIGQFVVGLEGTGGEVEWMAQQLRQEWQALGFTSPRLIDEPTAAWRQLTEFGCAGEGAGAGKPPTVLKLNVRPSDVVELCMLVRSLFPTADLLAHVGNGVVLTRLPDMAVHELAKPLLQTLQPKAALLGGQCLIWNSPAPEELTRQLCWGPARDSDVVLHRVKRIFDPKGLFNPGRFLFG